MRTKQTLLLSNENFALYEVVNFEEQLAPNVKSGIKRENKIEEIYLELTSKFEDISIEIDVDKLVEETYYPYISDSDYETYLRATYMDTPYLWNGDGNKFLTVSELKFYVEVYQNALDFIDKINDYIQNKWGSELKERLPKYLRGEDL